jgi:hypothetical protein
VQQYVKEHIPAHFLHIQQGADDGEVAGAGNGQKFRRALHDAEQQ